MSFWDKHLAPPAQAQDPAPPRGPWWAPDFSRGVTPQPGVPQQAVPHDELAGHDFSRATSRKSTERCPECDSPNYAKVGTKTGQNGTFDVKRCFGCGYPKIQEFSGMAQLGGEVDGRTRQVADAGALVHNWHPQDTRAGALRTVADLRRY